MQHNWFTSTQPEDDNSLSQPISFGKSSLKISLVLVGMAGLSGCSNNDGTRYTYDRREDCVKDWGETECPQQSQSSGGYHGGYVYYRSGHYNDSHRAVHAKTITRGGFGSHGGGSRGG